MSKNRFRVCAACGRRLMETEDGIVLEQRVAVRLAVEVYSFDGQRARRVVSLYQKHDCRKGVDDDSTQVSRAAQKDARPVHQKTESRRKVQVPGDTERRKSQEPIAFEIGAPYGVKNQEEKQQTA